jgi:beta-phosphoglucomutase-like phosphatase (HAD superfamily)
VTDAVVFDLTGVLLDSEQVWDEVRKQLVGERGAHWHEGAQREMMGMSSVEEELSLARAQRIPVRASLSARCERSS